MPIPVCAGKQIKATGSREFVPDSIRQDMRASSQTAVNVIPQLKASLPAQAREQDPAGRRRKQRSELILLSEGLPVDPGLPPIELADDFVLPRKEEIAIRLLCVLMTAIKADRMHQTMVLRVIRQYGLAACFSPLEKSFIRTLDPASSEKERFSWRYESAWVLLWVLGYVDSLGSPVARCNADFAVDCMRDRNRQSFIDDAKLRPLDQILDQADLVYRYRCALADASAAKNRPPADLNATIVFERHHAFNWLVRYSDRGWDDVAAED